jgi:hypothetical protein
MEREEEEEMVEISGDEDGEDEETAGAQMDMLDR